MPIEVENIVELAPAIVEEPEAPASVPLGGAVEQPTPEPAPKKTRRPPGSRNKPRVPEPALDAPAPVVEAPKAKPKPKKVKLAPPPPPSESESEASEEDEPEPPSPATQRRTQWAQYRQRQVDAHQQRITGYTNILDKMLHF